MPCSEKIRSCTGFKFLAGESPVSQQKSQVYGHLSNVFCRKNVFCGEGSSSFNKGVVACWRISSMGKNTCKLLRLGTPRGEGSCAFQNWGHPSPRRHYPTAPISPIDWEKMNSHPLLPGSSPDQSPQSGEWIGFCPLHEKAAAPFPPTPSSGE